MVPEGVPVTWGDVLGQWAAIECDLHEVFGIDVESGVLSHRTWRWLRIRIEGLLDMRSRLAKALGVAPAAGIEALAN